MNLGVRLALLISIAGWARPSDSAVDGWLREFEEGMASSKATGKDLLIDFGGSDWCLPCRWLKEKVVSKVEFIERAGARFVLVDIDLPYRTPIADDRKRRYEDLQERYGIKSVPSVVLALPDGRAYARATYREAFATPEAYWQHLAPLVGRGERLRRALARAETLQGSPKAGALVDGLAEVDARFVPLCFGDLLDALRAADPADSTGYLAYRAGRQALDDFQGHLDLHKGMIDPADVDRLIGRAGLRGESLQEALVLRAAGEVLQGDDARALGTFEAVLDAQATRTRFDRGDFLPLDPPSIAAVRRRIADGKADKGDGVASGYALHRIFGFDLPNAYGDSCGEAFRPDIRVREAIGDRYGKALIRSTESLGGEVRARALARGLEGTFLSPRGEIGEIVQRLMPSLVGKDAARAMLPGPYYPRWID